MPRYKNKIKDTSLQEYIMKRNLKKIIQLGVVRDVVTFTDKKTAQRFALRNKQFRRLL